MYNMVLCVLNRLLKYATSMQISAMDGHTDPCAWLAWLWGFIRGESLLLTHWPPILPWNASHSWIWATCYPLQVRLQIHQSELVFIIAFLQLIYSSGISRTGTFISCRFLLERLRKDPSKIDVMGTVLAIRRWRKSLVFTEVC